MLLQNQKLSSYLLQNSCTSPRVRTIHEAWKEAQMEAKAQGSPIPASLERTAKVGWHFRGEHPTREVTCLLITPDYIYLGFSSYDLTKFGANQYPAMHSSLVNALQDFVSHGRLV